MRPHLHPGPPSLEKIMRIKNLIALVSLALVATASQAGVLRTDENAIFRPTGKGVGEVDNSPGAAARAKTARTRTGSNGISYRGGPLLNAAGGTNVYYIWYGNWGTNTAPTILTDLASTIAPSPYFNINTSYYDGSGKKVANAVNLLGSTTDNSMGTALSDANIQTIVSNAISSGRLPSDTNAVYFVLTSKEVNETSGFCTQYCGWHNKGSIGGQTIKYSFVGNPDRCPSACSAQSTGPNGNAGADGMASIIAHELEEAVTDPELNAWYDNTGKENADKCAWNFGTTYTAANGALANMKLGSRDFLIQQNWLNASGGKCALGY